MSSVPSGQAAGRGVSLHGSMFCCSGACLVSLICTLRGNGRWQQDLGNWALELGGRIWILFFILTLTCCGTTGKQLHFSAYSCNLCLPCLSSQISSLYISECSGCTDIRSIAGNFTTKVKEPQTTPNCPPSKKENKHNQNELIPVLILNLSLSLYLTSAINSNLWKCLSHCSFKGLFRHF